MDEYIKRQDALDLIESAGTWGWSKNQMYDEMQDIPAEDVAPVVHAHWIVKKVGYAKTIAFCSACGCQSSTSSQRFHEQGADVTEYKPILTKYCPECGAKMDGKEG